jgi:hypothetical protein
MTRAWLPQTILRAASLLAPADHRAEWLKGWRSELWYIPRHGASRFCLGAFRDAIWVRRNSERPARRTAFRFESPLSCLAFLTFAATVSGAIVVCLPAPDTVGMLLIFAPTLLPARLTIGWGASRRRPAPWPNRLRRGIFLLLKRALVQPVMLCGFAAMIRIGPAAALPTQLANYALWFLTLRWALSDQRNRCPVCLRLLTEPVRMGAPSQTFLEWYGSESACSRGHGLLQTSEMPAGYSAAPEWHRLDDSWSGLFPPAAEARQR